MNCRRCVGMGGSLEMFPSKHMPTCLAQRTLFSLKRNSMTKYTFRKNITTTPESMLVGLKDRVWNRVRQCWHEYPVPCVSFSPRIYPKVASLNIWRFLKIGLMYGVPNGVDVFYLSSKIGLYLVLNGVIKPVKPVFSVKILLLTR